MVGELSKKLLAEELQIMSNNYNDIFYLYKSNIEFAKLSHAYPIEMNNVIDDVEDAPSFIDKNHKHYISIYNLKQELVAVLDITEGYSIQDKNNMECIWVGLLQIDSNKHRKGLGSLIINSLLDVCKEKQIKEVQLGVIQKNHGAIDFWSRMGFKAFDKRNNGELDLILMGRQI